MQTDRDTDIQTVLLEWRTKILNGFLIVVTGIAAMMTVATILDALSSPRPWSAIIIYVIMTLVVAGLAIFRKIDYRVRAWGILVICYMAGLITLATFGLGSAGRLYLLALPIFTLILIGTRSGISVSIISIITMTAFAFLADRGVLAQVFVRDRNSLLLSDWLAEFADTLGILSVVMVLLILFYGFQERLIARERRAQADLREAHALLEQQNATLEQKVQERTSELRASNHSLEQRNAALAILNSVSEAMTKTLDVRTIMRLVGDRIREIFDVDSSMIMLLDRQNNMIHVPYEYDRNEGGYIDYVEPFPLGTGLSSRVISTGQPLMVNTLEEEIANGAYFPPEIIAQGQGAYGQSWLGVPIMASDQVLGLIALADNRDHVFNQNHMRLLQTLSSNLGAAIENARLFAETQRLLKETEQRAAELTIINHVQEALVSNLDMEAIYELIGEKVQEVFHVQVVDIVTYDPDTNMLSMPYSYEKGDRSVITPREPYGFRLDVINGREALLINENFAEWASQRNNLVLTGTCPKSALFVPLMVDGNVRSIISIQDLEREKAFSDSDVRLLQTLANSMSIALENARLFNETQRLLRETEQRNRELAVINNVQQGLVSKLDVQSMIDLFGDELMRIFPPDESKAHSHSVFIALYEPQTDMIEFPYLIDGAGNRFTEPPTPLGPGLTSSVIRSGQPLVLNTLEEQVAHGVILFTQSKVRIESQSWLGVPIRSGDRVIGVISMQDRRPHLFTESIVRLLSTMASSLGVALENARLFSETQQRAAELAIINSVQAGLASKLDMQAIYELVGEKIRETFKAQIVSIAIYDRSTRTMHGRYSFENGSRLSDISLPVFGFRKYVVEHGLPLLINEEMSRWMQEYSNPVIEGVQPKSAVFIPLMVGDVVTGVVSLQNIEQENAFSDSDVYLLTTLANSMSVALENARLFNETQRLLMETEQRAAELATVNTVGSAIVRELELDTLINLVGEQIRSVFKTDIVYVALLDAESNRISFPYQYGEDLQPLQLGAGLTSTIIQSGEPLLINEDMDRQRGQLGTTLVGRRARSYLGVPIFVGGAAVGVISVQSTTEEGVFTENDQHLLTTIAANVGVALQNARLFDEIRHQQQVALESQRRLADIIDFLPDATLVIDRDGTVIAWNHAIEEMTGTAAKDMVGKGNYEYAIPFYAQRRPILIDFVFMPREEVENKYAHLEWDGEILTGEAHAPSLRNGARYLYATASALHDSQGNIVGAIETIRDITDRKHTEEELVKARASAEQANHAKSAFLANMSHELRTPLNAIIGFTRIVRRKSEGVLPEKQTENLDKVLTSAEHLLNLINTVLDIAKIEAGRMDVIAANFRVAALIDLCANTAQPLLRPNVNLEKQVDESLSYVYSDQDKIRQIVLNLLSNAAKFTHEGCITLSAHKDGDKLCIAVRDTGIGISDDALPRIFKEFQQADSSTTRQYGGTGLGLSISRNLARLLGGDLNVASELGKGSTFTLVIPAQYHGQYLSVDAGAPGSNIEPEPAPVQQAETNPGHSLAKKRLLVIDDDPDAVYLLQENLDRQEFEVVGTRSGEEGLHMARQQHPDAILLDIIMPGADGWQVLHALKEDPATAEIPVVLLTIVDKKALGFRLGASAYLLKPLDPVAVRNALARVIRNGHTQKHVLVVDDDPTVADMLRQFLPESEFRLDAAVDGVAGLQAIEAERPDVLLLDLMMPRLDGFGVIEHLRASPQTRDLPIIVISAKDLTADESARLRETVSSVLKKQGFEGDKLAEEINHAMRNGHRFLISQA